MSKKKLKPKTSKKGQVLPVKGLAAKVASVADLNKTVQFPQFKAGDNVKVHVRIKEGNKERIQVYEGLVLKRSNSSAGKSFTVRKISHGVGVERIFLENSPKIAKVEKVQAGKVRRAKMYYIRKLEGRAAKIERKLENSPTKKTSKKAEKTTGKKETASSATS